MSHAGLRFYVYLDSATPSRWRWRLYAANNRIIANSGENFTNYDDCIASINLVASVSDVPIQYSPSAVVRFNRIAALRRNRLR